MNTESVLKEAIKTGEILKVQYHGGSQPGALREISPISISGSKVRARCHTSSAVKMFVIDKIDIVEYSTKGESWKKGKLPENKYSNLSELFNGNIDLLSEFGWHIESDLVGDEQSITLHRCFKNGKPMKGYHVSISYEKYSYDMVVDWESEAEELETTRQVTGKRKRPWSVSAKNETTKSYGSLDKAAALFIEMAEKYAPISSQ